MDELEAFLEQAEAEEGREDAGGAVYGGLWLLFLTHTVLAFSVQRDERLGRGRRTQVGQRVGRVGAQPNCLHRPVHTQS